MAMLPRTLDTKLDRIREGTYRPTDFVIADAKDADMGFGRAAPGPATDEAGRLSTGFKSRADYLQAIRTMTESGLVDVMLMSASSAEALVDEGAFEANGVTPAVRLNDATDIWAMRGGAYLQGASRPFATVRPATARVSVDLGLYSVTFSNDLDHDVRSLEAYAAFRETASAVGLRHFLEVFNPAFDVGLIGARLGAFVNDCIIRSLAGVVAAERPLFLKLVYNGPEAMEELASYDPAGLVVGVLGGSKGTTRDTFELARQAERHGARIALFGRKINLAEDPLALVDLMRRVVEGDTTSADAVRTYHDRLAKAGRAAQRSLEEDLVVTDPVLAAEA
ncbi:MAG: hypothetical protein AAFX81_03480 [Pseudomonadota bacterium]